MKMKKNSHLVLYYFIFIMYLELWNHYWIYKSLFHVEIIYTMLFSLLFSLIFTLITKLGRPKTNRRVMYVITLLLTVIFCGNYLYTTLFSVPFTIHVTSMASQALEFTDIAFATIGKNIFRLLIFFIPFILTILLLRKKNILKNFYYEKRNLIFSILFVYGITLLAFFPFKNHDKSAYQLYWKNDDLISSIQTFGLLTAERLDIQRAIFGFEEDLLYFDSKQLQEDDITIYNKMNINFSDLIDKEDNNTIKTIYQYFTSQPSTKKNEYTGIYEGKNLIFILAESFNQMAVSESLTPTLYRLTHTGFHFNNFYSPVFLSTTGGEFQAMTGLVPSADTLNAWYKGDVTLPFSLGNILGKLGYSTQAYHDWEYNFYDRQYTMPTLGFPNYLACNNGLEQEMDCSWEKNSPDDSQLIAATFDKYASKDPFVTFYITVSGHFPYTYGVERRNYDLVKDLPYSDDILGYLTTQIDLDRAVERLINSLEKEGILDDTVICLVGDHYPYAIELDELNTLSTYERDELFEINHSDLIIWNNDTEMIEIDKTGSQIDILPTLLNLFGLEYDSRLMIGKDLLSETEGLAIFSDMSWISDSGSYVAKTKTFTPKKVVSEDYVTNMNNWVNNSVIVSRKIITNDIYGKIMESIGE